LGATCKSATGATGVIDAVFWLEDHPTIDSQIVVVAAVLYSAYCTSCTHSSGPLPIADEQMEKSCIRFFLNNTSCLSAKIISRQKDRLGQKSLIFEFTFL